MYILEINIESYKPLNLNILIKNLKQKNIIYQLFLNKSFIKKYTILKSPHVNKKAMEHFQFKIFKRRINIYNKNINNILNILIFFKKISNNKIYIKYNIKYVYSLIG